MSLHLESSQLKYSHAITTSGTEIALEGLTVLVGPNNCGKSTTLRDIRNIVTGDVDRAFYAVQELQTNPPYDSSTLMESMESDRQKFSKNGMNYIGLGVDLNSRAEFAADPGSLLRFSHDSTPGKSNSNGRQRAYSQNFGRFHVAHLTAGTRLELANSCPSIDTQDDAVSPNNLLQWLLPRKEVREKLSSAFRETFGMEMRFDPHGLAKIRLRVSTNFDGAPTQVDDAAAYFKRFPELEEQGDGMRSFAGIVLGLLLAGDRLILIDEPEAFLHPEQARRLGLWIARNADTQRGQQIVLATHNAHLLQGLIAENSSVKIIRLHRDGVGPITFAPISQETVQKLAKDPLLSSQRVIEAIFHNHTVICESDSDRLIYQAVAAKSFNATDTLFVNAQNKQTCGKIASTLIESGMTPRTVVDIDILRDSSDLRKLMTSYNIDTPTQNSVVELRNDVAAAIESSTSDTQISEHQSEELQKLAKSSTTLTKSKIRSKVDEILSYSKWTAIKRDGVDALEGESKEKLQQLLAILESHGIDVVPVGELESWIDLGRSKGRWVEPALEAIYNKQAGKPLEDFVNRILKPAKWSLN